MADVTMQVKIDGGAPQVGGVYITSGQKIQCTAASKGTWPSNPPPRWELYDYPIDFPAPSGWLTDTADSVRPAYYVLGDSDPPEIDTTGFWGPWKLRLLVAGEPADARTFVKIRSPNDVDPTAADEADQFWGPKLGPTGALQHNERLLEQALIASGGGSDATNRVAVAASMAVDLANGLFVNIGTLDTDKLNLAGTIENPTNVPSTRRFVTVRIVGDGTNWPSWGNHYFFGPIGWPNHDPGASGALGLNYEYIYLFEVVTSSKLQCLVVSVYQPPS